MRVYKAHALANEKACRVDAGRRNRYMVTGILGLGAMGFPMAENLINHGVTVYGFDVAKTQVEKLDDIGGIGRTNVAETVKNADVVLASLPTPAVVEDVMLGTEGVLASCRPGTCVVDLSSVAPSTSRKVYAAAADKGVQYADAPVSGGVTGARAGSLTVMLGGDEDTFEKVRPVLEIIGKKIVYVGGIGSGDAIKLVNNLLLGCNMATIAEALALGRKLGLSLETIRDIVGSSSGNSYVFSAKMDKFILPEQYEDGFATELQLKDLNLALDAAKETKSPLPMTAVAAQIFGCNGNMGNGRKDISSVVQVWERLTGIKPGARKEE